jgi:hypothetical protein
MRFAQTPSKYFADIQTVHAFAAGLVGATVTPSSNPFKLARLLLAA